MREVIDVKASPGGDGSPKGLKLNPGIKPSSGGLLTIDRNLHRELFCKEPLHSVYAVDPEPLARGKFATVRRCVQLAAQREFAAKLVRKRGRKRIPGLDSFIPDELIHEVAVLTQALHCPQIVTLHHVFDSPNELVLILELARGGDLQTILDEDRIPNEADAAKCLRDVLKGLSFLHRHDLAHLDIKPQNIVLNGEFPRCDVKLCDFGISRLITNGAEVREIMGTPDYVAPEVLNYEPISLATDMWSVGVLTYVLLTGCSPFGGETKQETFCNITKAIVEFPEDIFADISDLAKDFILRLLVKKPSDRMRVDECLRHPWLRSGKYEVPRPDSIPLVTRQESCPACGGGSGNTTPVNAVGNPTLAAMAMAMSPSSSAAAASTMVPLSSSSSFSSTASFSSSSSSSASTPAGLLDSPTLMASIAGISSPRGRRLSNLTPSTDSLDSDTSVETVKAAITGGDGGGGRRHDNGDLNASKRYSASTETVTPHHGRGGGGHHQPRHPNGSGGTSSSSSASGTDAGGGRNSNGMIPSYNGHSSSAGGGGSGISASMTSLRTSPYCRRRSSMESLTPRFSASIRSIPETVIRIGEMTEVVVVGGGGSGGGRRSTSSAVVGSSSSASSSGSTSTSTATLRGDCGDDDDDDDDDGDYEYDVDDGRQEDFSETGFSSPGLAQSKYAGGMESTPSVPSSPGFHRSTSGGSGGGSRRRRYSPAARFSLGHNTRLFPMLGEDEADFSELDVHLMQTVPYKNENVPLSPVHNAAGDENDDDDVDFPPPGLEARRAFSLPLPSSGGVASASASASSSCSDDCTVISGSSSSASSSCCNSTAASDSGVSGDESADATVVLPHGHNHNHSHGCCDDLMAPVVAAATAAAAASSGGKGAAPRHLFMVNNFDVPGPQQCGDGIVAPPSPPTPSSSSSSSLSLSSSLPNGAAGKHHQHNHHHHGQHQQQQQPQQQPQQDLSPRLSRLSSETSSERSSGVFSDFSELSSDSSSDRSSVMSWEEMNDQANQHMLAAAAAAAAGSTRFQNSLEERFADLQLWETVWDEVHLGRGGVGGRRSCPGGRRGSAENGAVTGGYHHYHHHPNHPNMLHPGAAAALLANGNNKPWEKVCSGIVARAQAQIATKSSGASRPGGGSGTGAGVAANSLYCRSLGRSLGNTVSRSITLLGEKAPQQQQQQQPPPPPQTGRTPSSSSPKKPTRAPPLPPSSSSSPSASGPRVPLVGAPSVRKLSAAFDGANKPDASKIAHAR